MDAMALDERTRASVGWSAHSRASRRREPHDGFVISSKVAETETLERVGKLSWQADEFASSRTCSLICTEMEAGVLWFESGEQTRSTGIESICLQIPHNVGGWMIEGGDR